MTIYTDTFNDICNGKFQRVFNSELEATCYVIDDPDQIFFLKNMGFVSTSETTNGYVKTIEVKPTLMGILTCKEISIDTSATVAGLYLGTDL